MRSRCRASSGSPASTTCRSISCCLPTRARSSTPATVIDLTERRGERGHEKIAIDLTRLDEIRGPDAEMLARYLSMIQVQRQDFNGRVLTVRADDVRAIACILDVEADQASRRLEDLGLRLPRP